MAAYETKLARKARHTVVIEMLTACAPPSRIVWRLTEDFSIAESTAWNDIRYVREEILPSWYQWEDKRQLAIEATAKLEYIATLAIKAGQLREAIAAIKQVCMIQGLNQPVQVVHRSAEFGLEAFNAVRQIYSLPQLTQAQFDERKQGVKRASSNVSGGNGVH